MHNLCFHDSTMTDKHRIRQKCIQMTGDNNKNLIVTIKFIVITMVAIAYLDERTRN